MPQGTLPGPGLPVKVTVNTRVPAVVDADSMASPPGAWYGSHDGGTTVTVPAGSTATRVTRTALPRKVNSQAGTVAGPRVVWICTVLSRAAVTSSAVQPEQSPVPTAAARN